MRTSKKKKKTPNSPRLLRFAEEYCVDFNGYKAAMRAGYSKNVALGKSKRLLSHPVVKKHIQAFQKKLSESTEITAKKVLDELAKVGFSNIQDFITEGNEMSDFTKISRNHAAAVEAITVTETKYGEKKSFKLHSKIAALQKLGEHLNLFKPEKEEGDTPSVPAPTIVLNINK